LVMVLPRESRSKNKSVSENVWQEYGGVNCMFLFIGSWYFLLLEPIRREGLPNTARSRTEEKKCRSSCFAPTLSILHIEHEWTHLSHQSVKLSSRVTKKKLWKYIILQLEILTWVVLYNISLKPIFAVRQFWPFPWESGAAGFLVSKDSDFNNRCEEMCQFLSKNAATLAPL